MNNEEYLKAKLETLKYELKYQESLLPSLETIDLAGRRRKIGMTAENAADLVGINRGTLHALEKGKRKASYEVVRQLVNLYVTHTEFKKLDKLFKS